MVILFNYLCLLIVRPLLAFVCLRKYLINSNILVLHGWELVLGLLSLKICLLLLFPVYLFGCFLVHRVVRCQALTLEVLVLVDEAFVSLILLDFARYLREFFLFL